MTTRVIDIHHFLIAFLAAIGFVVTVCPASAQVPQRVVDDPPGTEYFRIGGDAGWGALALQERIDFHPGWKGGDDIVIADGGDRAVAQPDLHASFDAGIRDFSGRYRVGTLFDALHVTHLRKFGGGAVAFDGTNTLSFMPEEGSVFTPYAQTGSFAMSFWLYPTGMTDGVEVLRWNGAFLGTSFSREADGGSRAEAPTDSRAVTRAVRSADADAQERVTTPMLQEIRFYIRGGVFRWELSNVVADATGPSRVMRDATLSARRGPVPQRWTHHQLRYDAARSQLTYLVDGIPETILHLSTTGTEDGAHFDLLFGEETGTGIVIGDGYRGLIDEFVISRDADRPMRDVRYDAIGGTMVTDPISLPPAGGYVGAIRSRVETPGNTEVRLYYRTDSEELYGDVWRRVPADGFLSERVAADSIQLKAELLTDASGDTTPRLQEITVAYEPFSPPPTPIGVRGRSIPDGVEIAWEPVFDENVVGYRVLFGERPGRYIGTAEKASPIEVRGGASVTIDGLEENRSYVFAVESFDSAGQRSGISREIEVRAGESE